MATERSLVAEQLGDVEMFRTCEQCGCCSSACPITGADGFNVRRIIRHVELELIDDIAATPHSWACTTCGRCETACPNGIAILDIIRSLRGMAPAALVPDGPPPCTRACPAGIDVPGYLRLIAEGKPDEAHALVLEEAPFPGVLGRVCTRPCEAECVRGLVNEPLAICALKRHAADKRGQSSLARLPAAADTGHSVAVVGAGPAGLTAAVYLRRMGHQVTVFEARSEPGGMMRSGIPWYRLPAEVLDDEVQQVLAMGVELETGQRLGVHFDLASLRDRGCGALLLALGLQESRKIELEGSQLDDVLWGIDLLMAVSDGTQIQVKPRVAVIGGGSVAADVALTAARLGAREVTVACLECRDEMPANPWEVETILEEGVALLPSWGPARIASRDGIVTGVELKECTSVFDRTGHFSPTYGDARLSVDADQVILAIGQMADLSCLEGGGAYGCDGGLIAVGSDMRLTGAPDVFACGDVVSGPGSIVEAIASGKRAARAIDLHLGGDGCVPSSRFATPDPPHYDGQREKGFADLTRARMPLLPPSDRRASFAEIELGLSDEQARAEAARCLSCDLEVALALGCR